VFGTDPARGTATSRDYSKARFGYLRRSPTWRPWDDAHGRTPAGPHCDHLQASPSSRGIGRKARGSRRCAGPKAQDQQRDQLGSFSEGKV